MTMYSRKHYQHIATMLGDIGRPQSDHEFSKMLATALNHLAGTNPQMDVNRIVEWAHDVRDGRRDINGDKVDTGSSSFNRYRIERERLGI